MRYNLTELSLQDLWSWTEGSAPCSAIASLLHNPRPIHNLETVAEAIFSFYVCTVLEQVPDLGSRSPPLPAVITHPPTSKLGLAIIPSSRQGFLIFQETMPWLPPPASPATLAKTSDVEAHGPCQTQRGCKSFSVFAPLLMAVSFPGAFPHYCSFPVLPISGLSSALPYIISISFPSLHSLQKLCYGGNPAVQLASTQLNAAF